MGVTAGRRNSSRRSYAGTRPPQGSNRGWSARRKRRFGGTVAVLLTVLGVAGAFAWAWTQPVPLEVMALPEDAIITVASGEEAVGVLKIDGVSPGTYAVTAARQGFETRTVEVEAERFRGGNGVIQLTALPQQFRVDAQPQNARITVRDRLGTEVASGEGLLETSLESGYFVLQVAATGRNTYEQELFLDSPYSLSLRLDPEGQVVRSVALIPCAGAPKGVALTPDGSEAWATILNGPPSVEIFDPLTGRRIGEVDIGEHGAVEIVFSRDGLFAYASQMETARVFEIDVKTRQVVRSLDTESAWTKVVALSPDGKTLYAANWSGSDVSEIDLESGSLRRRIRVASTPRGLWPSADGKTLWVASFGTGDLERVDLKSGDAKRVFSSGGALRHLVADEAKGLLFASDMAKNCVWVTDMKTNETRKFSDVDQKPNTIDLSPDGKVLFVSCRGANNPISYYIPGPEWGSILLLDTESAKPLDAIVGGNQCTALDVSDDGSLLLFSDFLDDRLRSYAVPDYGTLAGGGGGRFATYKKELIK
jgi:DNA-binding beta-propeller fold protein YncE